MSRRPVPKFAYAFGVGMLLLLAHLTLRQDGVDPPPPAADSQRVEVRAVRDTLRSDARVVLDYVDVGPRDAPVVVLLHGSPGSRRDFRQMLPALSTELRVLAVDLPGFGRSTARIPDYSFRAHAVYVAQLLERLHVSRAHFVGFSMGGGVALELARQEPERLRSLVMLSSIGVQELELLGNYEVNHALHGAQLGAFWTLDHVVPHFGRWGGIAMAQHYARNFYDSDQRPLRGVLGGIEVPALIVHGDGDFLVPIAAAREHHRLMPQSELVVFEGASHFLVWTRPDEVVRVLSEFFARVESGDALTRDGAEPARIAAARVDWSELDVAEAQGMIRWILLVLIVFSTFVSEDLTSIATGLLIAQGRLGWQEGFAAVFVGIYVGDLVLYGVGRLLGATVVHRAPWRYLLRREDLEAAARWFERRGFWAILMTRVLPGSRLPAYVAAGVLKASFWRFALFFFVAVLLWTPALVGFSAWVGHEAMGRLAAARRDSLWWFVAIAVVALLVVRLVVPLCTPRGRSLARSRWIRLRRWEYWPSAFVYSPVAWKILGFARRYGGLTTATAVNTGIEAGGFVGESKSRILEGFGDDPRVARFRRIPVAPLAERRAVVEDFLRAEGLDFPVVLKPDAGQRGEGVVIVRDVARMDEVLERSAVELLVQEYIAGLEFGVFYMRDPEQGRGFLFSVAAKLPLVLVGDGEHDLEFLILHHDRALAMAERHLRNHAGALDRVLADGEPYVLVEIGTHARGATFLDARSLRTDALEAAIDELSRRHVGFDFGRYDLRVESEEALRAGRGFKILEANGLTSEAAHVYDPSLSRGEAVSTLIEQWEWAYRIGAANRRAGRRATPVAELVRAWWEHRRRRGDHFPESSDTRASMR